MKSYKTNRLIANKFSSIFKKSKTDFSDGQKIYTENRAQTAFDERLVLQDFTIATITHYEVLLIHEYLKIQARGRGDYSKKVYLPEDYRVNSIIGTMTKTSVDHVAHQYLKDLDSIRLLNLQEYGAEERMLISSYSGPAEFVLMPTGYVENTGLLEYLAGKRVLVLSSFSELIKIQHLNQKHLHPGKSETLKDFEILTLNIEQLYREKEAYSLFEKLDALKIEILKYDFDLALINLAVLNIPIAAFVASLHRNALALGDDIYQIFGIAKDSAEKSSRDKLWVDLNSYRQGNEDTFLATGVIGAPIIMKKPKKGKHVH